MRQVISVNPSDLNVLPNEELDLSVIYSTEDPVDETLTGLGLRLHFDSEDLTFNSTSNPLATDLFGEISIVDDTDDFDSNSDTDKFILATWTNFSGNWPGEGNTPATLYSANFTASEGFTSSDINFTAASTAAGYELDADSVTVEKADEPPTVANAIDDLEVTEDSTIDTFDLSDVFSDPDGDAITKSIQSNSNENLVTASIDGNDLTLTLADNQSGEAEITVRGTSKELFEDDTFKVTVTPVNDAPVIDDATFSISENVAPGTTVGTMEVADVDDDLDNLTFALTVANNPDTDGDGDRAFRIVAPESGSNVATLVVKDSDEFDFETNPQFELEVRATDNDGARDTATATVNLTNSPLEENSGIFSVEEMSNYVFSLLSESTPELVNELGIFTVDDASGSIGELSPEDNGYLDAALERSQILFSVLANPPVGFDANIQNILSLDADSSFGFYLLPDNTSEMAKTQLAAGEEVDVFLSSSSNLTIEPGNDGFFTIKWEESAIDAENPGDFDDLVLQIATTNEAPSLAKNAAHPEILDLTNVTETSVDYTMTMTREADFDSVVALYEIQDTDGTIVDPTTGASIEATAANSSEYLAVAESIAQNSFSVEDDSIATSDTFQVEAGKIYAPILTMEVDGMNEAYTPFMAVNTQGMDRVRSLGDNIIGFEDHLDNDYNDLVVEFDFI